MEIYLEIYLAIIGTYMSVFFTLFVIYLKVIKKHSDAVEDKIMKDNEKWKNEVRELIKSLKN